MREGVKMVPFKCHFAGEKAVKDFQFLWLMSLDKNQFMYEDSCI